MHADDLDTRNIASSYVRHGEQWWNVSTGNRRSSALGAYESPYAETIVWVWDVQLQTRGEMVYIGSGAPGSLHDHCEIVKRLSKTGDPRRPDEREDAV